MSQENVSEEAGDQHRFQVDLYPTTIQFVAFIGFIVGSIGGYFILTPLFGLGTCSPFGIVGGVIIGGGAAYLMERGLKRVWTSRRYVRVRPYEIAFEFNGQVERSVHADQHVNVILWCFAVKRRTRVPKGHYVVSLALEQNDIYLPIYTVMPPDDFKDMNSYGLFTELSGSREDLVINEGDYRLAGQQRRLMTAETARTIDGVEMPAADFQRFIKHLQEQFPSWMPGT